MTPLTAYPGSDPCEYSRLLWSGFRGRRRSSRPRQSIRPPTIRTADYGWSVWFPHERGPNSMFEASGRSSSLGTGPSVGPTCLPSSPALEEWEADRDPGTPRRLRMLPRGHVPATALQLPPTSLLSARVQRLLASSRGHVRQVPVVGVFSLERHGETPGVRMSTQLTSALPGRQPASSRRRVDAAEARTPNHDGKMQEPAVTIGWIT